MNSIDSAAINQQLANYVYGIDPNAQYGESLGGLALNIGAMGALTVGAQKLSPLFGKYYDAWKNKRPGMTWTQSLDMAQARFDQKKMSLDYLNLDKNGNKASIWQRNLNKVKFERLNGYEAALPQMSETAQIGPKSQMAKLKQKYINQERSANCFKEAQKLINEAKTKKMTGAELKAQLQKIEKAMAKGELRRMALVKKGIIKPTTIKGKIGNGIRKYSGWNAIKSSVLKSKNAGKFMKGLKAVKGGFRGSGIFAAIGLAMEAPDIIKGFNINKEVGMKQVKKSVTKTAAGIGGWAAGAAIGQMIIPIPGLGAMIGGLVGSYAAGKLAEKVVGEKPAAVEYYEEQAKLTAAQADKSPETQLELMSEAANTAKELGDEEMLAMIDQYAKALDEQYGQQTVQQQSTQEQYVQQPTGQQQEYSTATIKLLQELNSLM